MSKFSLILIWSSSFEQKKKRCSLLILGVGLPTYNGYKTACTIQALNLGTVRGSFPFFTTLFYSGTP